ncbi:NAD(P)-binding protein [Aspergillus violaceofuscus CBS 115571]|uniref:NAD(P)-binding protein n=1 Tax=Aspergillus violaceofuscus (strain CBS 115571) TaxID=1450538 RepID=A0A2V5I7I3_ASPV1|nr:NAD(P)-binding protein [Aspergillus violaceofuscus CBS 115571]
MSTSLEQYISHFDGLDGLRKVKAPLPSRGPGEVLVKINAVSLNYRDMEVIRGEYTHHQSVNQGSEIIPCSDMAATITAVGAGVTRWQVGDRVVSTFVPDHKTGQLTEAALKSSLGLPRPGVLATHRIFREGALVKTPAQMSDEEACTLPIAAVTAWMALTGSNPLGQPEATKGKYILLQGTGGVSVAGLLLGKALGAKVIITSSSDEKLARAKELGADFGVNYKERPDWEKYVMEVTDGHGADIILETGGSQTIGKTFACAAYGGLINCIGYTSGKTQVAGEQPNVNVLTISRCLTLRGFVNGPTDRFEEMAQFAEQHGVHPVICRTFGFDEAKDAFKYMEAGSHFGKIVVRIGQ